MNECLECGAEIVKGLYCPACMFAMVANDAEPLFDEEAEGNIDGEENE